jgi:glycosyltransferase involved in cell wall biosynthesis
VNNPGISLIIPAYNAARYLGEAIDSALNQTVKPRQIIVVDDCSTDDSVAVARSYGDALQVIVQEINGDVAIARNRGLLEVNQPLIAFLDADDRFVPTKLQRQLEALSNHPDAMLCICGVCDFWSPDLPETARRAENLTPQIRPGQAGTWLLRREVTQQVGPFSTSPDFRYSEGSELYTRIERAGLGVVRIEDVLVERRLHAANKTTNSKSHLDGIMALMKQRLDMRRKVI